MAMPLIRQLELDFIAPPVIAAVWWLLSRGWAAGIQGGDISEQTKKRQKIEFPLVLVLLYVLMFGTTIYLHFIAR